MVKLQNDDNHSLLSTAATSKSAGTFNATLACVEHFLSTEEVRKFITTVCLSRLDRDVL